MKSRQFLLHPFLFAVFPVLFLYSNNMEQLALKQGFIPALFIIFCTGILTTIFSFITRGLHRGCILTSLFLMLFFSYGHFHDFLLNVFDFDSSIVLHYVQFSLWITALFTAFLIVRKYQGNLNELSRVINIMAVALIMISVSNIIIYEYSSGYSSLERIQEYQIDKSEEKHLENLAGANDLMRDIYYIIPDSYPSESILEEYFSYDNSPFLDKLRARGFSVMDDMRSNYAMTFLSLASTLNMEYVNFLSRYPGEKSKNRYIPYRMIMNSRVQKFLQGRGYKSINLSSGWGPTDWNHYADVNLSYGFGDEFQLLLIQSSMIYPFENKLGFIKNHARNRVIWNLDMLKKIPEDIKSPKFVLAHFLPPHPPYLFDQDGNVVPGASLKLQGSAWNEKDNYLNQLKFMNQQMLSVIDNILKKSEHKPIILIQADHGPATSFAGTGEKGWIDPPEERLRERMTVLGAYYLPSAEEKVVYDEMTPVNLFRMILDHYFEATLPELEDKSYFSSYITPYQFHELNPK